MAILFGSAFAALALLNLAQKSGNSVPLMLLGLLIPVAGLGATSWILRQQRAARTLHWYVSQRRLRAAFVSKVISSPDFDPTYRFQPWDQIPASAFKASVVRFEMDGELTRWARTVKRVTTGFWIVVIGCTAVILAWASKSDATTGLVLVCVLTAGAWLYCRMDLATAQFVDGSKEWGRLLGEQPEAFPDTPEVITIARKMNLWWVTFPLSLVVMFALVAVISANLGNADNRILMAVVYAPVLISRVGQLKWAKRLKEFRLPD